VDRQADRLLIAADMVLIAAAKWSMALNTGTNISQIQCTVGLMVWCGSRVRLAVSDTVG